MDVTEPNSVGQCFSFFNWATPDRSKSPGQNRLVSAWPTDIEPFVFCTLWQASAMRPLVFVVQVTLNSTPLYLSHSLPAPEPGVYHSSSSIFFSFSTLFREHKYLLCILWRPPWSGLSCWGIHKQNKVKMFKPLDEPPAQSGILVCNGYGLTENFAGKVQRLRASF